MELDTLNNKSPYGITEMQIQRDEVRLTAILE